MDSEPGDYIGGGDNYYYTPAEGAFSSSQNYDNGVRFGFANGSHNWSLDFAAPDSALLKCGSMTTGLPPADDREAAILATLPAGGYTRSFEARPERPESLWWKFIVCPEWVSINSWMVDSRASRDMLFVMPSVDGALFLSRSFSSA